MAKRRAVAGLFPRIGCLDPVAVAAREGRQIARHREPSAGLLRLEDQPEDGAMIWFLIGILMTLMIFLWSAMVAAGKADEAMRKAVEEYRHDGGE
jgi:hypothetical protein